MAYRYEGNELIIDGWERGISDGPYSIFSPSALGPINQTGTVDISYANIYGVPGEVSVNFPLRLSTISGAPPNGVGTPIQIATGINNGDGGTVSDYYMLDSWGQIYISNLSGQVVTWTYQGIVVGTGLNLVGDSGIVFWQGYLFTIISNKIYYSANGGVSNTDWTGTVGAPDAGSTHYAISSRVSDRMYFCNNASVGALILTQGKTFDPTDASTYTFQLHAVHIPAYDLATCLGELNGQVLIGAALNRVYTWDALNLAGTGITSQVSTNILFLADRYVQRIVISNSNAYVFTGHPVIPTGRGNIYITNGSTIDIFKKMPDNLASISGTVSDIQEPYWRFGDAMFHRNKLFFGAVAIGNKSQTAITNTGGVWCISLDSQALFRANKMTTSTEALATVISPLDTGTAIPGLGYITGTVGANTVGVMNNTTNTMSTSAIVISDKIPVGTKLIPKTFEQLELKMAVALVSGESVDVVVITDLDPTGQTIGSMTNADGMSKVFTPLALSSSATAQGLQWLQVKCTLNPTDTNPTYVRLRDIRLR